MIGNLSAAGVLVPDGFATTAEAYWRFIGDTGLADMISAELASLDTDDVQRLAEVGSRIRAAVVDQAFPADLEADIRTAYERLAGGDEEEGRSRCGRRRRRRTCRTRPSPVSRRLS